MIYGLPVEMIRESTAHAQLDQEMFSEEAKDLCGSWTGRWQAYRTCFGKGELMHFKDNCTESTVSL